MSRMLLGASAVCCAGVFHVATAAAAELFSEDFEGYTSFPTLVNTFTVPSGGLPHGGSVQERINLGIPRISEGAKGVWYGGRFEDVGSSTSSISDDLAVQNYGSINRPDDPNANYTHVGRIQDDAGLLFKVSTAGFQAVNLSFAWRTYDVESSDFLRAGYRLTNPGFGTCVGEGSSGCFADLRTGTGAWGSWTEFSLSDSATSASPKGNSSSWIIEGFALPSDQQQIWVAFWLDNGAGDIGKIDNVMVTASPLSQVPVPAAAWLMMSGLGMFTCLRRRRLKRAD